MLNELFVGAYQGKSAREKENILEELYSETNLDDINIGSSLYLTLEASRPLEIDIHPNFRFLWGQDAKPLDAQVFSSFADEAGPRLDLALGWLLPVLEPHSDQGNVWPECQDHYEPAAQPEPRTRQFDGL